MRKQFTYIIRGVLLISLFIGLTNCQWFDRARSANPTQPQLAASDDAIMKHKPAATYMASATPGITVRADFTTYHVDGMPYGNWVVEATWRSQKRKVVCLNGDLGVGETPEMYLANQCAWAVVPVTIDETTGQGTAWLSPEFLNIVFQAASAGNTSVWTNAPGLHLNFYQAADDAGRNYDFQ